MPHGAHVRRMPLRIVTGSAVSKIDLAKRLTDLERENGRLKRAVSELALDKLILKESLPAKVVSPSRKRAGVDHARSQFPRIWPGSASSRAVDATGRTCPM